jgi:predicted nucleic acid-binding protein
LALGGLKSASEAYRRLSDLRVLPTVEPAELTAFIEGQGLARVGIGFVDASILASAKLAGASLLTYDARLAAVAKTALAPPPGSLVNRRHS